MTDATHTDGGFGLLLTPEPDRMDGMEARPTIPNPEPGTCGCGCGEPVKSRFKPGHDARLKSILVDVSRNGERRQAEKALNLLVDRGWGRFADTDKLRTLTQRNRKGQAKRHIESVERWLTTPTGIHHCNAACPDATTEAKATGNTNAITKLASSEWFVRIDASAEATRKAWSEFAICQTCTTEETVDERIERVLVLQWLTLDALDQEAGVVKTQTVAQRKLANKPFEVEPDTDAEGNILPIVERAA